jgi:hypothetical protein
MTFIQIKRNLRLASVIAGFIALAIGLSITQFKVPLAFFNIADYMPQNIEGIGSWLYRDTIKGFLIPNLSVFLTYFFPIWIISLAYLFKFRKQEEEVFKRGSKIQTANEVKKIIYKYMKKTKDYHRLELGLESLPMPESQIVKNLLLIAMPGAGKTQALYSFLFGNVNKKGKKLIKGLSEFNETIIAYERKGSDFISPLYRRGKDYLFDPRDQDTIRWNIIEEMLNSDNIINETMVDFCVNAVSPVNPESKSAHFEEQAQSVIKAIFLAVAGSRNATNKGLIDFLRSYPSPKLLREALINNPTVQLYGVDNAVIGALTVDSKGELDNQATSVYSSCNKTLKALSNRAFYYEESDFSVKGFIEDLENDNKDIRLFIVNTAETAGSYNTYFILFFALLFKHTLSLSNSKSRRIHLVLDELMSLHSTYIIKELVDTLSESRSKGLNAMISFQGLTQLVEITSEHIMKSLFQMCGTKIALQYSEPYGQKILSQFLGEKEIERKKYGINRAGEMAQDRLSENEEEKLKKVVLESEFANLEPLEGFIKIGNFPVTKIHFGYQEPKAICNPLIRRELPFFDKTISTTGDNYIA